MSTNLGENIVFLLYLTLVTSCIIDPFLCCHLLYLILYLPRGGDCSLFSEIGFLSAPYNENVSFWIFKLLKKRMTYGLK